MFVNNYLPYIAQARACLRVIEAKKVIKLIINPTLKLFADKIRQFEANR